jgi:glycosyltransferase involved in cell wall biosynthesis
VKGNGVRTEHKPAVLLCGPPLSALGGGPTHIRNLLASPLKNHYRLFHFETGSRGSESPAKDENPWGALWRAASSPLTLAFRIARVRPAVVHINSAISHKAFWRDLVYLLVSKIFGRRVVFQLHGGAIPLSSFCRSRLMRLAARTAFSWADVLVLLATSEKREFAQLGISKHAIVLPNGIDVAEYRGRTRVHSGRAKRLAYLGRLFRPKGIFEAMEAVDILRKEAQFADIELHIAGSGPAREEIESFIRDRDLDGNVKLIGALHGPDKVEFLRNADIFVFPSYHQEGLPYAILESLAAGTPVIASRVAGIPDVVLEHVHGMLIDTRSPTEVVKAIRALAQSEDRLRSMSKTCVDWAWQRLSLERLATQFSEVYEDTGRHELTLESTISRTRDLTTNQPASAPAETGVNRKN